MLLYPVNRGGTVCCSKIGCCYHVLFFFFQAEDGIRVYKVTGVQTCALPICISLGVNIDHVATLRQARRGRYPDPVHAALAAETAGADSITLHLREDRRHIQDHDVRTLHGLLQTRMNLELAVTGEMLAIAAEVRPADCCLVPERRQEIPTDGGLDVAAQAAQIGRAHV